MSLYETLGVDKSATKEDIKLLQGEIVELNNLRFWERGYFFRKSKINTLLIEILGLTQIH